MNISLPPCPLTHFNPTNFSEGTTGYWVLPEAEQELEWLHVVPTAFPGPGQDDSRRLYK